MISSAGQPSPRRRLARRLARCVTAAAACTARHGVGHADPPTLEWAWPLPSSRRWRVPALFNDGHDEVDMLGGLEAIRAPAEVSSLDLVGWQALLKSEPDVSEVRLQRRRLQS
jgi:hypothetical protein